MSHFPLKFAILDIDIRKARIPSAPFLFHQFPNKFNTTGANLEITQGLHPRRPSAQQAHGRTGRTRIHVSRRQLRHWSRQALRRQRKIRLRCNCQTLNAERAEKQRNAKQLEGSKSKSANCFCESSQGASFQTCSLGGPQLLRLP